MIKIALMIYSNDGRFDDCDLLVIFSTITSKFLVVKTNDIQTYIDTLNP